ncbi:MAG TPA: hypothetical protein VNL18_15615 [Gemmatimonadales bacterium]|nr:hypothetical protein [Gemmatimonadales bacterium]
MTWLRRVAYWVLDVGERRCAWCQTLLGWRRHIRPRGGTSHGLCGRCADLFDP